MKLIDILEKEDGLNAYAPAAGTDKNTTHNYINGFYDKEFSKYQDKKINLLEIGIYSGASLYLWSKYFKNAEIYGIDIINLIRREYSKINNVKHLFANAYDVNLVNTLPDFDIIIDDGPHTLESQIFTLTHYINKLKDGGVLIIEDVQNINHFNIFKSFIPEDLQKNTESINVRSTNNRYDDLIFVFRK
jgi:precorrin-6B methylase 2